MVGNYCESIPGQEVLWIDVSQEQMFGPCHEFGMTQFRFLSFSAFMHVESRDNRIFTVSTWPAPFASTLAYRLRNVVPPQ
jgi:hypothetical protein